MRFDEKVFGVGGERGSADRVFFFFYTAELNVNGDLTRVNKEMVVSISTAFSLPFTLKTMSIKGIYVFEV